MRAFLREHGLHDAELFPMVRGRLTAINERAVGPDDYDNPRAKRFGGAGVQSILDRPFAGGQPHPRRPLVEPGDQGQGVASVETGWRKSSASPWATPCASRSLARNQSESRQSAQRRMGFVSGQFFVVFPSGVLDHYPATWITSFHLPAGQKPLLADLVRQYPSVTVLDVDALMSKVREIMDRVIAAVEYVFPVHPGGRTGGVVRSHSGNRDERRFESAVLRTLGARRAVVRQSLLAEFATLGLLAGILAATAATVLGYVLAARVFEFPINGIHGSGRSAVAWVCWGGFGRTAGRVRH